MMGETDRAIEYYHRALALDPTDPIAELMLGKALEEFRVGLIGLEGFIEQDESEIMDYSMGASFAGHSFEAEETVNRGRKLFESDEQDDIWTDRIEDMNETMGDLSVEDMTNDASNNFSMDMSNNMSVDMSNNLSVDMSANLSVDMSM
eukprot:TRINITY_DN6841_c0_g1_i2.p1 TRINITY_DN6841_c0_g1~~TRINITY_DN6841_c0_g1_i2.p1  ORF type:complete len:148 (+),score=22.32 TRINITY_DN6841_c0_g1_i2:266-709(+)